MKNSPVQKNRAPNSEAPRQNVIRQAFFKFGIGIWLVMLNPILIWCVVGTLSAHGFQDKLRQVTDTEGMQLSLPTVIRLADQLKEIENRINKYQIRLDAAESTEIKFKTERLTHLDRLQQVESDGKVLYAKLQYELKKQTDWAQTVTDAGTTNIRMIYELYFSNPDFRGIIEKNDIVRPLWKSYKEKIEEISQEEAAYDNARSKHEQVKKENETIAQSVSLQHQLRQDLMQNSRIDDIVNELRFMRIFNFDYFATMPSQHLTLILTLCMGALGSLIYITQDYLFGQVARPFSWYIFRPFLGMVTAVAIFILAKAGQITISDASFSGSGSENLNPYFISFLAIISGLLSEHAIHRIQSAGISVFRSDGSRTDEKTERWAVGIKEIMTSQDKTVEQLGTYIDKPLDEIEDWVDERVPVPREYQTVISSWLEIPARKLFTDIPPLHYENEEEKQG